MSARGRITKAFEDALTLPLNQDSRYILISDCHRGSGNANDNFLKNEFLYLAAMNHYFRKEFTYIELGDGDELWENRSFRKIKEMHQHSFEAAARFYAEGRMYSLYGNHDMAKKKKRFAKEYGDTYYCARTLCERPLFPDITFHSGIILRDEENRKDIYLTHGHQAELLNSVFWRLSRFLVRYVWRPLEGLGVPDPTSAAKNNTRKKQSEKRLAMWAEENGCILITGHTHHPMLGSPKSPYFNTGSCVHPAGITGIEIENRCITPVKWQLGARDDMTLYAEREVLGGTVCVDDVFPGLSPDEQFILC